MTFNLVSHCECQYKPLYRYGCTKFMHNIFREQHSLYDRAFSRKRTLTSLMVRRNFRYRLYTFTVLTMMPFPRII
jgi:hypothetical protein